MLPMKLDDLIGQKRTISMSEFSNDKELSKEVQQQLSRLGILDPPADGEFGPVSLLAGREFVQRVKDEAGSTLDWKLAARLTKAKPETLLPVQLGKDLASTIWRAMMAKNYFLARVPGWINIVYLEGANVDGAPNDNRANSFNDMRVVLTVQDGKPAIIGQWDATTEPGRQPTETSTQGAAHLALDQFKAWCVGTHKMGSPSAHEALVQRDTVRVFRDRNRDNRRDGDAIDIGSSFGINQHWGFDQAITNVGNASAGCLVGRTKSGHRQFMAIVKSDPRYKANNGYKFMTAILPAADIQPFLRS